MKREKVIVQEVRYKFIIINPDKEDFDISRVINEIFRHIKQSSNRTLINKISTRLLN